jgi:hypothetical protein
MLESRAPRLTDRRSEPRAGHKNRCRETVRPQQSGLEHDSGRPLKTWSAMHVDVLLEGLGTGIPHLTKHDRQARFVASSTRSLPRAAHRLSALELLPANCDLGGLAGSRSSGVLLGAPHREGLPLAARPEPFAAFPARALPSERASTPLVARGPVPAEVCQGGASRQTRRFAGGEGEAPPRGVGGDPLGVGGDPLPRPVLAKPGFVDSPGERAQDVWAGGSDMDPNGQPVPPQVTLLCRCPPDEGGLK